VVEDREVPRGHVRGREIVDVLCIALHERSKTDGSDRAA
jgi:hypothetical protein